MTRKSEKNTKVIAEKIRAKSINYDEDSKSISVQTIIASDPKNRTAIYNSLQEMNKELVIILYGSVDKFIKAKKIHPLEKSIFRYDNYMGIENDIISLSMSLNIQLVTNEPSVEMYPYLRWMAENPDKYYEIVKE